MAKYFGTDGIRGKNSWLTPNLVRAVGRGVAAQLKIGSYVLIGKDTRLSGDAIECALASELAAAGINVVLMGIAPTPAVATVAKKGGYDLSIMVSASHNPPEYNGIKIMGGDGFKLSDQKEADIEQAMDTYFASAFATESEQEGKHCADSKTYGKISFRPDLLSAYFEEIIRAGICSLKGLKIALDCGFGGSKHCKTPF